MLGAGRQLFAQREYVGVSAEEIVRTAGLTRGALYHHFDGKRGLFEAIFEDLESQAAQRIRDAISTATDPFERLDRGVAEFLDISFDHLFRQVAMLQGPVALGWQRWRELDQHYLGGIIFDAIQALLDGELIEPHPIELLASAFYGALAELALTVDDDSPQHTRRQARKLVRALVEGIAAKRVTQSQQ